MTRRGSSFRICLLFPLLSPFALPLRFYLVLFFVSLPLSSFISISLLHFRFLLHAPTSSSPPSFYSPFCCFQSRSSICFLILRFRIRGTMIYRSPPRETRVLAWQFSRSLVTLLFIPLSSFPRYIVSPTILSLHSNRVSVV